MDLRSAWFPLFINPATATDVGVQLLDRVTREPVTGVELRLVAGGSSNDAPPIPDNDPDLTYWEFTETDPGLYSAVVTYPDVGEFYLRFEYDGQVRASGRLTVTTTETGFSGEPYTIQVTNGPQATFLVTGGGTGGVDNVARAAIEDHEEAAQPHEFSAGVLNLTGDAGPTVEADLTALEGNITTQSIAVSDTTTSLDILTPTAVAGRVLRVTVDGAGPLTVKVDGVDYAYEVLGGFSVELGAFDLGVDGVQWRPTTKNLFVEAASIFGVIDTSKLGTGVRDDTTTLHGDGVFRTPSGTVDSVARDAAAAAQTDATAAGVAAGAAQTAADAAGIAADAAQTDATAAGVAAAAAQSTATGAAGAAAAAQATASTAVTNAATAQTAADGAQADIDAHKIADDPHGTLAAAQALIAALDATDVNADPTGTATAAVAAHAGAADPHGDRSYADDIVAALDYSDVGAEQAGVAASLIAALDYADVGAAPAVHVHAIADVTGLQTALDGKAASSHNHAASAITSGTVDTARLGSGTADNTKFLRGDQTWAVPTGGSGWSPAELMVPGITLATASATGKLPSHSASRARVGMPYTDSSSGNDNQAYGVIPHLPWTSVDVWIDWLHMSSSATDVRWQLYTGGQTTAHTQMTQYLTTATVTAGSGNDTTWGRRERTKLASAITVTDTDLNTFTLTRLGADAADTLTGTVYVVAVGFRAAGT